eukprot:355040-Chlamydomonas_euryale.AAC.17
MSQGRRSRPIMPAEAETGMRPRTCMHVNAPRPPASGIYVHACPGPRAGQGRGRRDRPRSEAEASMIGRDRPEAETSMFCSKMTQPRFRMRVNARAGPSCIQHRRDLWSNKCMHERTHIHHHASCIILVH